MLGSILILMLFVTIIGACIHFANEWKRKRLAAIGDSVSKNEYKNRYSIIQRRMSLLATLVTPLWLIITGIGAWQENDTLMTIGAVCLLLSGILWLIVKFLDPPKSNNDSDGDNTNQ